MDLEMLKVIASQGVVGVLAFGMFKVYEKTTKEHAEKLEGHVANYRVMSETLLRVLQENSATNAALKTFLEENLNGHLGIGA